MVEPVDIFIEVPPNIFTIEGYSRSGSIIMILALGSVRNTASISRLAAKDFPEPGQPKINPAGFIKDSIRLKEIRLLESLFNP